MTNLSKTYNPQKTEQDIYQLWEKSGKFNPDNLDLPKYDKSYTIILPPPNITDKLHLGHSSMLAIEDLLIRYHRMKDFRTLWLPGTDHAAIATQNIVEKKLLEEKKQTRYDLGREKFMKEAWSFMETTQSTILNQIRRMGASLDWSRLAFTLDKPRKKAVEKMFIDMYQAGAIYRGERIVNWCPRCQSTLADDEVEHKEEKAKLYWLKYGPFVLATSRPETKLGDTAVAVHPDDKRYQEMIDRNYDIQGVLGEFTIKVVADKSVDPDFGSGAIKVTPAHSFIDNEIAARHNLPSKKIINEDGKMMENCGKYSGMEVLKAREAIVADMKEMGLIDHIDENYKHSTTVCYRCDTIIEPLPSEQWFISVDKKLDQLNGKSLKEKALEVAQSKEIEFIPERFNKRYQHWMENLHDWCISRQIWLGHRIPAWHKNGEIKVQAESPGNDWAQDPDTLDTWFSSGMWTFSTLGWPDKFKNEKKSGDLAKFHPTQVLETGYDILTLWVSRMIMMSLFAVGEIPFKKVHLHGMVLDQNGKKMSKSKGNGIDPIEMIDKYGTDAVRLALLLGSTAGNDVRVSERKIEGYRNFINKLWNISRFVLTQLEDIQLSKSKIADLDKKDLTLTDEWLISEMHHFNKNIQSLIENHEFSAAGELLKTFTRDNFADWYLEICKIEKNKAKKIILSEILKDLLKLWHPYVPFVTETIWQKINPSMLMTEKMPDKNKYKKYFSPGETFSLIKEIIIAIRNARAEYKLNPQDKIKVIIQTNKLKEKVEENKELIKRLKTYAEKIEVVDKGDEIKNAFFQQIKNVRIYIPLEGLIDFEKEKNRLKKEKEHLKILSNLLSNKLDNENFIKNAPKQIIKQEQEKKEQIEIKIKNIDKQIDKLK
jgi:valyl-tRNA synthetase